MKETFIQEGYYIIDNRLHINKLDGNILFNEYLEDLYIYMFYLFKKEKICVLKMTKAIKKILKKIYYQNYQLE